MKTLVLCGAVAVLLVQACGASDTKKKPSPSGEGDDAGATGGRGGASTSSGGTGGTAGASGTTGGSPATGGRGGTGGTNPGGAAGAGATGGGGSGGTDAGTDGGAISNCPAGFEECDGDPGTACETPTTLVTSCGSCTTTCNGTNGTVACQNEVCTLTACNPGFGDCDTDASTGCETTLTANAQHCGACGRDCTALGSTCGTTSCASVPLFTGLPINSGNSGARTWAFGNGAVYHQGFNSYTVLRLPVDGSAQSVVWTSTAAGGTESLLVTSTGVMWAERGTPPVYLQKAHGAAPAVNPQVAFTPEYTPTFVRIQGTAYYWLSGDYQSGDPVGYVYTRAVSAPLGSDPGTPIVTVNQGNHGSVVAFQPTSNALYWVTSDATVGTAYEIRTTPLAGGTPTAVPGGAITAFPYTVQALLLSAGNTLYFNRNVDSSFLNGIYRYASGDAAPEQLVVAEDVVSFLVDAGFIYYISANTSGVFKAPIAGGAGEEIASVGGLELVGQDATAVYLVATGGTSLHKIIK